MLSARRDDPYVKDTPALNYCPQANDDPINMDFIANFGMVQSALETNRLEAKGKSERGSYKGKGRGRRYEMPSMPAGLCSLAWAQGQRQAHHSSSCPTDSCDSCSLLLGPSSPAAPDPDALEDSKECPICLGKFATDEVVVRLSCRHLLHAECCNAHAAATSDTTDSSFTCPICRNIASIRVRYPYIHDSLAAMPVVTLQEQRSRREQQSIE